MPVVYLNGKFCEQLDAALDPLDRGVMLGDGVFETIRCERGQLLFHVAHFARLGRSARLLEIPWNTSSEELLQIAHQVLDANNLRDGRVRVTLTRGEMGPSPEIRSSNTAPTLIIHAAPVDQEAIDAARERGWSARLCGFPINHRSPLAEVKSTSYQEHLLARLHARREGYDESILLNTDGFLAEGAMSNLFIVKNGEVFTPPVRDGALPGIVRLKISIICARLSIAYVEESLSLKELETADEAFMTSSLIEVMPLVTLGEKRIGNGKPGPMTERLYKAHRGDVEQFLSIATGD